MTEKKIPMRQCVGCREMLPKRELVRIVRTPEGELTVDSKGKLNGRGAYICPKEACLRRAQKAKALERNLQVSIPEEIYTQLAERMTRESDD